MKHTGLMIKKIVLEVGGPMKFCAAADISIPTLYKLIHEKPVNEMTLNKIDKFITQLRKSKAVRP